MQAPPQARAILNQFLVGTTEVGYRIGVPHVWPSGSTVTISGQATTGQATTGATVPPVQFGTPTTRLGGPPQTQAVTGITSPQAFGTIRTAVKAPIGAVNSAQAFGVPTPKTVISITVGGVPSAQAFGTPLIKTVIRSGAGGVSSAQSFGAVTAYALYRASVSGVGSAQSFGSVTTRTGFTKAIGGVSSAQALGAPTVVFRQALQVGGINSAQAFGALTIKGAIRPQAGGVPSAQAFGAIHAVYRQTVALAGVSSAQAFGTAFLVFHVWLRQSVCTQDNLVADPETTLTLSANQCIVPETSICGVPICGDGHLCGYVGNRIAAVVCLTDSPITSIVNKFVCGDGTVVGEQAITYLDPVPAPLVFNLDPVECA